MKYLLSQFFLFPVLIFAQASIKGVVFSTDKQPLPLSNIVVVNKSTGTITDENGAFSLENVGEEDSVKVSNVAYQSRVVPVKRLRQIDTIQLGPNEMEMDEIVMGDLSRFQREQMLGFNNYSDRGSFQLWPGSQLATYIANDNGIQGYIKGVTFRLKDIGMCKNSMRLRLLTLDTLTSLPAKDLLRENIMIPSERLSKSNYVNLSRYKIMLPYEGVVVVLEWVFPDKQCNKKSYSVVSANLTVPKRLVWLNYRDDTWKKSNLPSQADGNFMTPNVGVRVGY